MIVEVVVTAVLIGLGETITVGVDVYLLTKVIGMVMATDVDLMDAGEVVAYAVLHTLCVL